MTKNKAIIEILLCSALWSIAGIFMKWIPWSALVIASFRSLLAGCVAYAYMRATKQKLTFTRFSVFGAVSLCATMTLFCLANKTTTAANAIVLQFTDPIWIILISAVFFHKRFTKADVLAVVFTFGGIALFFADGLDAGNTVGNLIALGSGVTFACYYITLGGCPENERMSAIVLANAMTFLIGLPLVVTTKPEFSAMPILFIAVLGVFQLGIPYVLLARGSGWCPPLVCSLLGALEPLLNPVWVAIFDGETPGFLALVGGAIVIATITAWCIYDARHGIKSESAV